MNFALFVCSVLTVGLRIRAYCPSYYVALAISSLDKYRRRMPDFLLDTGYGVIWIGLLSLLISPLPMHSKTENLNHAGSLSGLTVSFFYVAVMEPKSIMNAQNCSPSSTRRGLVWIDRYPLRLGSILQDQSRCSLAAALDRRGQGELLSP